MNRQMPSGDRYTDAPADIAAEIEASVPLEDDFPSPEELRRELKRSVTIRLDPEVYSWFQLPGPGYQTRINAVLRQYMKLYQTAKSSKRFVEPERIGGRFVAKVARKAAPKAAARRPAKKSATKARPSKAKQKRAVRA